MLRGGRTCNQDTPVHPTPFLRDQSVVAQEDLGSLRCPQDAQPWDLGRSLTNQVPEGLETSPVPFSLWNSPREVFSHTHSQMLPQKCCWGGFTGMWQLLGCQSQPCPQGAGSNPWEQERTGIQDEVFSVNSTLCLKVAQVAQRSFGCSIPGNVPGLVGWVWSCLD